MPDPGAGAPVPGALLLVGCGKMGSALVHGWLAAHQPATEIAIVEPSPRPAAFAAIDLGAWVDDVSWLPAEFRPDVVVFAVKPQAMAGVLPAYRRFVGPATAFLSIAAGRTIGSFEAVLGAEAAIVRAMPNTPAAIGCGISVACANARVTAEQRAMCDALLRAVGEVAWVEDEALLDPVTAVSGSGPAYVFLLVEALADAGIAAGLPSELALRLARATVEGSGELLRRSIEPPAALRQAVTSPGGTTAAALEVLTAPDGLGALMTRAVAAATRRSRELAG
ncbi:MAG TPA: pyrroline-5-carboxylate reductase [Alphaproteobacteria bacterium]|nr:pyrroline-5-carboxylate reductase [Alphaproteobacteria bacterium]